MRGLILLLILGVGGGATFLLWPRFESERPILEGPDRIEVGAGGTTFELAWIESGSGLREISAVLEVPSGAAPTPTTLHEKAFPGNGLSGPVRPILEERISLTLPGDLPGPDAKLAEGEATLVVRGRDWSWSGWGAGNLVERRIPVLIDTTPPRLSVESGLTYIRRGGAAAVIYQAGPDAIRSGVRVGSAWFPGTTLATDGEGSSRRVALFAIPIDAKPEPEVEVRAFDKVGNQAIARFDVRLQERDFPETSIALSDGFLDGVGTRLGKANQMTEATPLATFQRVNSELRESNERVIAEAIEQNREKSSKRQWSGAFEQMRNSTVTSKFAELRHYTSNGNRVSRARHYGFDLASTARAPITASNGGTILFAGDNGIYGNLVLIDHGLGVTSLYGHLSNLAVKVGDRVEKGQELGRSGATGLAGGDHLHFAILVGTTYVDPVEWWDPKWMREHIDVRLSPTPPGEAP